MISQFIISSLIILISLAYYKFWVKPKKIIRSYAKQLKDLGYKVHETSYTPFKSHLLDVINKGIQQGDALKMYKEYFCQYDVVVANFLFYPRLELINLDFTKDFYTVDKHYCYPKDRRVVEIYSRLAGEGLPFSEGPKWKRKRTILNRIFNFDFVKSQSPKIAQICADNILAIEQESQQNKQQKSVSYNIIDLTTMMFSGVMMEIFLGGTKNQLINGEHVGKFVKKLFGDLGQQSLNPINFILGSKILSLGITKSQREIQSRVQAYRKWGVEFIKKRMGQITAELEANKQKNIPSDIIEAILMARRNAENTNEEIIQKEEEIFEEFNAFFAAGTDTTSTFTQMIIYQIARHPQIQAKVRQEIDLYMKDENYDYENLKNFKYIDMLQKETTRCHGPGTHLFARMANVDNYLNGIQVRKGTVVNLPTISNHYSQKYFKNPKEFRPERWESECDNLPQFAYAGFSAGARTCIGKHLAMLQSKIALIKFMKRYSKITLPNNNFKMVFKFLYCPEDFTTKMIISL